MLLFAYCRLPAAICQQISASAEMTVHGGKKEKRRGTPRLSFIRRVAPLFSRSNGRHARAGGHPGH